MLKREFVDKLNKIIASFKAIFKIKVAQMRF